MATDEDIRYEASKDGVMSCELCGYASGDDDEFDLGDDDVFRCNACNDDRELALVSQPDQAGTPAWWHEETGE